MTASTSSAARHAPLGQVMQDDENRGKFATRKAAVGIAPSSRRGGGGGRRDDDDDDDELDNGGGGAYPSYYSPSSPVGPASCEYCGAGNTDDCGGDITGGYDEILLAGVCGGTRGDPPAMMMGGESPPRRRRVDHPRRLLRADGGNDGACSAASSTTTDAATDDGCARMAACHRPKLFFLKKRPPFATADGWNPITEHRINVFEPPSTIEGMGRGWGGGGENGTGGSERREEL